MRGGKGHVALKEMSSACSMLSLNSDLICSFYLLKLPPSPVALYTHSRKSPVSIPQPDPHYSFHHIPTLLSRQINALGHE